ncbi:PAS domain-containing protein [Stakelama marina]|nr:PAS domain-containing protein [Stakelama marina]
MNSVPGTSADAHAISVMGSVGLDGNDLVIALLEQSDDCIKILSIDGHLDFMNCNGLKAMEIDFPELVLGKLWWKLWPSQSQDFVKQCFLKAARGEEARFEADCPTAKGTPHRWNVHLKPLTAREGTVVSVLSTSRMVTGASDTKGNELVPERA